MKAIININGKPVLYKLSVMKNPYNNINNTKNAKRHAKRSTFPVRKLHQYLTDICTPISVEIHIKSPIHNNIIFDYDC